MITLLKFLFCSPCLACLNYSFIPPEPVVVGNSFHRCRIPAVQRLVMTVVINCLSFLLSVCVSSYFDTTRKPQSFDLFYRIERVFLLHFIRISLSIKITSKCISFLPYGPTNRTEPFQAVYVCLIMLRLQSSTLCGYQSNSDKIHCLSVSLSEIVVHPLQYF